MVLAAAEEVSKKAGGKEINIGTAVSLARLTGVILDGEALEPT